MACEARGRSWLKLLRMEQPVERGEFPLRSHASETQCRPYPSWEGRPAGLCRKRPTEASAQDPHRLVWDIDAAIVQQVLDVPEGKRTSIITAIRVISGEFLKVRKMAGRSESAVESGARESEMTTCARLSHSATCRVGERAVTAFAFLSDPMALSRWSLGCMDLVDVGDGVFMGRSLFDGGQGWLSIDADSRLLLVDYHVGDRERREPRISARVIPGPVCGLGDSVCTVTLTAWRSASMNDERWSRLCASHEAEIWLIKSQIETRHRQSTTASASISTS